MIYCEMLVVWDFLERRIGSSRFSNAVFLCMSVDWRCRKQMHHRIRVVRIYLIISPIAVTATKKQAKKASERKRGGWADSAFVDVELYRVYCIESISSHVIYYTAKTTLERAPNKA